MNGNKTARLVLTSRDHVLFRQLAKFRLIDREQAKVLCGFRSTQRVNARLLKLTNAGLIKRFFVGTRAGGTKAVYSLNRKSIAIIGHEGRLVERAQNALLVGDQFVHHQLLVNDVALQIAFKPIPDATCARFVTFLIPLSQNVSLIPDGYFEIDKSNEIRAMFCEVDRGTESQRVWAKKIALYLKLAASGEFQRQFGRPRFRALVIATSERRLLSIRRGILKQTNKIFWLSTLESINREGFWSRIWLRPDGDQRVSLL